MVVTLGVVGLWALFGVAQAGSHVVVQPGQTVESIARDEQLVGREAEIRQLSGLGRGAQPTPGAVLLLPIDPSGQESLVLTTYGVVTTRLGAAAPAPLVPGARLAPGAEVCTAAESFVTLRLVLDESTRHHDDLTLMPESCVVVERVTLEGAERSSLVSLGQGSVTVQPNLDGHVPGRVTVRAWGAVTSGLGGGHRMHVERGALRAEAVSQPLEIYGGGARLDLSAGEGSRSRGDAPPDPAVKLLIGPATLLPEDHSVLRSPDFTWSPVPRALGYQVELSTDPYFTEPVLVVESPLAEWLPEAMLLPWRARGVYWRVIPVDRFGYLGVPSETQHLRFPPGSGG
ncbi:MAG: hypothetical protein IPN01_10385 [Deltaproteobacteria bacterium]|nr:hypothetical protein [Deltaproteobacteria bacterium]